MLFPAIVGFFPTFLLVHLIKGGRREVPLLPNIPFSFTEFLRVQISVINTIRADANLPSFPVPFVVRKNSGETVAESTAADCIFYLKG
jgi:hypothetical protein